MRQIGGSPAGGGSGSAGGSGAVFGFYPQMTDNQGTSYATGDKLRTGVQADGPSSFSPARVATDPGAMRLDNYSDPRSTQYGQQPSATGTPSSAPASTFSDSRSDAQRAPSRNPEDPYGPKTTFNGPVDSPPTTNNITRVGNSYSGTGTITEGATINGMKYGDSGVKPVISDSNMQAANALDARERMASVGRVQAGGGAGGAPDARSLGSQVGWAGDPKNPQVYTPTAADRLTSTGFGAMRGTPELYRAKYGEGALRAGIAAEQGAMNAERADATNRFNTQTQADVARGAQGVTQQNNVANQQQDQREFGLKSTSAGIDARSKLNMAGAQEAYMNAKTPEARANALSTLQGLSGHTPAPKFTVLRGRKDADGNTEGDQAVNNSTGQFLQPPAPQRAVPPAAIGMLKSNPKMAAQFDSWYGPGASSKYLGGR